MARVVPEYLKKYADLLDADLVKVGDVLADTSSYPPPRIWKVIDIRPSRHHQNKLTIHFAAANFYSSFGEYRISGIVSRQDYDFMYSVKIINDDDLAMLLLAYPLKNHPDLADTGFLVEPSDETKKRFNSDYYLSHVH